MRHAFDRADALRLARGMFGVLLTLLFVPGDALVLASSQAALEVRAVANPDKVPPGGVAEVAVYVQTSDGVPAADAQVTLSVGGGTFTETGGYSAAGSTDSQGFYRAHWRALPADAYPASARYVIDVQIGKAGYPNVRRDVSIGVDVSVPSVPTGPSTDLPMGGEFSPASLVVAVEAEPESVAPGGRVMLTVDVGDPGGRPPGEITVTVAAGGGSFGESGQTSIRGATDRLGRFRTEWRAPAWGADARGRMTYVLQVEASAPGGPATEHDVSIIVDSALPRLPTGPFEMAGVSEMPSPSTPSTRGALDLFSTADPDVASALRSAGVVDTAELFRRVQVPSALAELSTQSGLPPDRVFLAAERAALRLAAGDDSMMPRQLTLLNRIGLKRPEELARFTGREGSLHLALSRMAESVALEPPSLDQVMRWVRQSQGPIVLPRYREGTSSLPPGAGGIAQPMVASGTFGEYRPALAAVVANALAGRLEVTLAPGSSGQTQDFEFAAEQSGLYRIEYDLRRAGGAATLEWTIERPQVVLTPPGQGTVPTVLEGSALRPAFHTTTVTGWAPLVRGIDPFWTDVQERTKFAYFWLADSDLPLTGRLRLRLRVASNEDTKPSAGGLIEQQASELRDPTVRGFFRVAWQPPVAVGLDHVQRVPVAGNPLLWVRATFQPGLTIDGTWSGEWQGERFPAASFRIRQERNTISMDGPHGARGEGQIVGHLVELNWKDAVGRQGLRVGQATEWTKDGQVQRIVWGPEGRVCANSDLRDCEVFLRPTPPPGSNPWSLQLTLTPEPNPYQPRNDSYGQANARPHDGYTWPNLAVAHNDAGLWARPSTENGRTELRLQPPRVGVYDVLIPTVGEHGFRADFGTLASGGWSWTGGFVAPGYDAVRIATATAGGSSPPMHRTYELLDLEVSEQGDDDDEPGDFKLAGSVITTRKNGVGGYDTQVDAAYIRHDCETCVQLTYWPRWPLSGFRIPASGSAQRIYPRWLFHEVPEPDLSGVDSLLLSAYVIEHDAPSWFDLNFGAAFDALKTLFRFIQAVVGVVKGLDVDAVKKSLDGAAEFFKAAGTLGTAVTNAVSGPMDLYRGMQGIIQETNLVPDDDLIGAFGFFTQQGNNFGLPPDPTAVQNLESRSFQLEGAGCFDVEKGDCAPQLSFLAESVGSGQVAGSIAHNAGRKEPWARGELVTRRVPALFSVYDVQVTGFSLKRDPDPPEELPAEIYITAEPQRWPWGVWREEFLERSPAPVKGQWEQWISSGLYTHLDRTYRARAGQWISTASSPPPWLSWGDQVPYEARAALYIEIGLYDEDPGEDTLIGLFTRTFYLEDLLRKSETGVKDQWRPLDGGTALQSYYRDGALRVGEFVFKDVSEYVGELRLRVTARIWEG